MGFSSFLSIKKEAGRKNTAGQYHFSDRELCHSEERGTRKGYAAFVRQQSCQRLRSDVGIRFPRLQTEETDCHVTPLGLLAMTGYSTDQYCPAFVRGQQSGDTKGAHPALPPPARSSAPAPGDDFGLPFGSHILSHLDKQKLLAKTSNAILAA